MYKSILDARKRTQSVKRLTTFRKQKWLLILSINTNDWWLGHLPFQVKDRKTSTCRNPVNMIHMARQKLHN